MNFVKRIKSKFTKKKTLRSPEIGIEIVRISHKVSSTSTKTQYIKVGGKFYLIRELG